MSVTSLDWGQLLGQMTTLPQETYRERAIRLALDLQGILHLAQRVQEEVHCQGAVFMAAKFEVFPTLSLKNIHSFYFSP